MLWLRMPSFASFFYLPFLVGRGGGGGSRATSPPQVWPDCAGEMLALVGTTGVNVFFFDFLFGSADRKERNAS